MNDLSEQRELYKRMYVRVDGMAGYRRRRGLGAEQVTSDVTFAGQPLPCCADAIAAAAGGCDDSCVGPSPLPSTGRFYDYAAPLAPKSQTLTQWFNANSTALLLGGAGLLGVVLLGGRR